MNENTSTEAGVSGSSPESSSVQPVQTPAPVTHPSTAPPAARVVLAGTKTEREIDLEAQLAEARAQVATTAAAKKAREVEINELQDRLRSFTPPPPPEPKKKRIGVGWFEAEEED